MFSRPGYCEVCDGWLGESDTDRKQARSGSATTEEQVWSSTQVEGLLAMLPSVDPAAARESFRRSLVAKLATKLPQTVRYTKQQLNWWRDIAWNETVGHAREWLALSMLGDEAGDAIKKFLDRPR